MILTGDDHHVPGHTAVFSAGFLHSRYPGPAAIPKNAKFILVRDSGICVAQNDPVTLSFFGESVIPLASAGRIQYLGHQESVPWYAVEVMADVPLRTGKCYPNLRELYGIVPDEELAIASFAVRIISFDRNTRFCGRCGAETRLSHEERSRICDSCGLVTYPRISPAIIVLVKNGDRVLLARSPRFPPGQYSLVAGFVEAGETLEETVRREVMEETGIRVKNIRYCGSEPWPFPDSLMIGFVADYDGGEIAIDNREIEDAGWFSRDHLPHLPSKMSLSRAIIDAWTARQIPEPDCPARCTYDPGLPGPGNAQGNRG